MANLSSAAMAVHDVGLATSIGGTLFGRTALQPALHEIASPAERDRVSANAWRRFSLFNLLAHTTMAVSWLAGRSVLSRRGVPSSVKTLARVKDGLVIASLVTGVSSILLGRKLGKRSREGLGPAEIHDRVNIGEDAEHTKKLQHTVSRLGILNLITNIGILGISSVLAYKSHPRSLLAMLGVGGKKGLMHGHKKHGIKALGGKVGSKVGGKHGKERMLGGKHGKERVLGGKHGIKEAIGERVRTSAAC